jgi:hypothetical protein
VPVCHAWWEDCIVQDDELYRHWAQVCDVAEGAIVRARPLDLYIAHLVVADLLASL